MQRMLEYGIFFVVLLLLQVFLFDNLTLSTFVMPMAYVAFIVLLPVNTKHIWMLVLGLMAGLTMDLLAGTGGVHTITSMATAFMRPWVLNQTAGKDVSREGGTPSPKLMGIKKWLKYSYVLVIFHSVVFFIFEAFTFRHFGYTALRILGSSAATLLLVWFIGAVYPSGAFVRSKIK